MRLPAARVRSTLWRAQRTAVNGASEVTTLTLRGARMLLAGACTATGQRACEAFLALGAHVVAADRLRTRLEELRAAMRQHERLWVAESDSRAARARRRRCSRDVARDEPIDAAILVAGADAAAGCESFLDAVIEVQARNGRGCVLIAIVGTQLDDGAGVAGPAAFLPLLAAAVPRAAQLGIAVCGAIVELEHPAALARMMALCDPERPAASGLIAVP